MIRDVITTYKYNLRSKCLLKKKKVSKYATKNILIYVLYLYHFDVQRIYSLHQNDINFNKCIKSFILRNIDFNTNTFYKIDIRSTFEIDFDIFSNFL